MPAAGITRRPEISSAHCMVPTQSSGCTWVPWPMQGAKRTPFPRDQQDYLQTQQRSWRADHVDGLPRSRALCQLREEAVATQMQARARARACNHVPHEPDPECNRAPKWPL